MRFPQLNLKVLTLHYKVLGMFAFHIFDLKSYLHPYICDEKLSKTISPQKLFPSDCILEAGGYDPPPSCAPTDEGSADERRVERGVHCKKINRLNIFVY